MSENITELGTSVLDDDELLRNAKNAENGRKFSLLFEKGWNSTAVRNAYEKPRHARLALLNNLAWWSRHDTTQMWRLFQRSALCPGELATYREYFADLVRSVRSLLGDECYDPNYARTNGGEAQ